MPEQDADASELGESQEVCFVSFVARDQATVVLQPGEQALDLPSSLVAAQRAPVLGGCALSASAMGTDHLDAAFPPKVLI